MLLPPQLTTVLKEIGSLLYWSMLAACTVGPGTVVTCARAGSEYQLSLIWALVFASFLAYILQEGTARLTIVSGRSLGQCLRIKYRGCAMIWNAALICWVVAVSVFVGNTLYECNNFAGGIDAILAIPGTESVNQTGLRVGCCIAYAVIVMALLYLDKTDMLGILLGVVMVGMVVLFLVVVVSMEVDWPGFGWGFIPNIPVKETEYNAEPTDIVVSLVGTTSIGFNLFLGSSMAEGRPLKSAQRGIAFSTLTALCVSVLILIVGSGAHKEDRVDGFTIQDLSMVIEETVGQVGLVVFAVGFIAAALSSMLTVPLGAALTADSLMSESPDADAASEEQKRKSHVNETFQNDEIPVGDKAGDVKTSENGEVVAIEAPVIKKMNHYIYLGIMAFIVIVSCIVISCNADRTVVILIAQVFNGCLLPFFCICLLICINDNQFMGRSPQRGWSNILLLISVTITLFLTANVIIQKIFHAYLEEYPPYVKLIISACLAVVIMALILIFSSLGKDFFQSLKPARLCCNCKEATNSEVDLEVSSVK